MDDAHATTKSRFLTVHEAAELLRLAPKSLYSLVSQRRVPFRKAGRRLLFLESELIDWTKPKPCRQDKYSRRQGRM
jgi:excisionase family DNA binding protein